MIVYVAFEFEGVKKYSQEDQDIRDQIAESLRTMGTAFDASDCWIDNTCDTGE